MNRTLRRRPRRLAGPTGYTEHLVKLRPHFLSYPVLPRPPSLPVKAILAQSRPNALRFHCRVGLRRRTERRLAARPPSTMKMLEPLQGKFRRSLGLRDCISNYPLWLKICAKVEGVIILLILFKIPCTRQSFITAFRKATSSKDVITRIYEAIVATVQSWAGPRRVPCNGSFLKPALGRGTVAHARH